MDHDDDHQRKGQQRQQQADEEVLLWRGLGFDDDTLLLKLSDEAGALRDVSRDAATCRALGNDLLPLMVTERTSPWTTAAMKAE
jgi:hypothetical protein